MREVDWQQLRPLPTVAPWNKGQRSLTWEQRRDAFAGLPKSPLLITADLVTPILHAERDRTHLDGLLSAAALTTHPTASHYDQAAVLPLPLALAWVSPQGLPLWACTPLMPVGIGHHGAEVWHKRYPSHRAEFGHKLSAVTSAGRWKEYRVPVRPHQIDQLQALAIGHAESLEALLAVVTHLGKKGSMGYGRVARWTLTAAEHSLADVLARRPVPTDYDGPHALPGIIEPHRGWTPPYWYSPRWSDCTVPP